MDNFLKSAATTILLSFAAASCAGVEPGAAKQPRFTETINAQKFFKGNIHAHTTESDGDAPPAQVLAWYRTHGYGFVALTDHDKLTRAIVKGKDFVSLNGVEITGLARANAPIHVNAICGKSALAGVRDKTQSTPAILAANIALSRDNGAVTLVNHPNFGWAISPADLLAVDGFELLEIASGHPEVHDAGDASHPSEEELWDTYLSRKHRVFGAAVDDAHDFRKFGDAQRNPGRAWVQVWAPELGTAAICEALRQGHFYSSRGSRITALVVQPRVIELAVEDWQPSTDHVDFIGVDGQLLDRTAANPARYALRGGEGYVRAHVFQSNADHLKREAWTQAYFVKYD